MNFLP